MELKKSLKLELLGFFLLNVFVLSMARKTIPSINWVLKETKYTRLCSSKNILTVNGLFPGPTLYVRKGDRLIVNVQNQGKYNVTIHWHGVKQPRNPWSDGPVYVTQCPIRPGANFSYELIFSTEEGTLWWHAHSDWSRATVHGPIVVYPSNGTTYPFPKPHAEFPIVLASWFKGDVMEIIQSALEGGGEPNKSDALTINGQPGDLYNCSKPGTFNVMVNYGKRYLLRVINSIMNEEVFFAVAKHKFTVVGMDAAYIKPIETDYILITPGQTMDILLTANKSPSHYYMAARASAGVVYDNTTTTAIVKYIGNYTAPSTPAFPSTLPNYTDIDAVTDFTKQIKALASKDYPIDVPKKIDTRLFITISVGSIPCPNDSCEGPDGSRLAASLNNVSFKEPTVDLLQAYYRKIGGIFTTDFPNVPPYFFNFTADVTPDNVLIPSTGTKVKVLEFNSTVEIVFQGTNILNASENHPMHLHGFSFYHVGSGFGNFDNKTDPKGYNLVDPPEINTVGVPKNGWATIRFRADNPGVWFMHCHLERHSSWGMDMAFIVKNGSTRLTSMRRPPRRLNPC
ncbi:laccase-14-like [Rhododendron vialii]|uniref:laccase-14-like n=1 Tax=Rhododendron vialii TaxID=182163 RepID=UPI00265E1819|nr:laccase-14-like [Rhododendron vialii]